MAKEQMNRLEEKNMSEDVISDLLSKTEYLSGRIDVISHNLDTMTSEYNNFLDSKEMEKLFYMLESIAEYAKNTHSFVDELTRFELRIINGIK